MNESTPIDKFKENFPDQEGLTVETPKGNVKIGDVITVDKTNYTVEGYQQGCFISTHKGEKLAIPKNIIESVETP
jgi:hypothetical protein